MCVIRRKAIERIYGLPLAPYLRPRSTCQDLDFEVADCEVHACLPHPSSERMYLCFAAATAAHFDQFLPFDRSRGHCPMFGYNTGKVFQDARFRLGLYLREAGVSSSRAAHAAVMRSVGPLPDAPF